MHKATMTCTLAAVALLPLTAAMPASANHNSDSLESISFNQEVFNLPPLILDLVEKESLDIDAVLEGYADGLSLITTNPA